MRGKQWTREETEYLIKNYAGPRSVAEISLHLGIAPAIVGRKARKLGFSQSEFRRFRWSQEELSLLEAWAETKPMLELCEAWNRKAIKSGWPRRSPEALTKAIERLGYSAKPIVGCYSVPAVAAALTVAETTVLSWSKNYGLKAQRQGEGERSSWIIRQKSLAEFALCQPSKVGMRITSEGTDWLLQVIADSRKKN